MAKKDTVVEQNNVNVTEITPVETSSVKVMADQSAETEPSEHWIKTTAKYTDNGITYEATVLYEYGAMIADKIRLHGEEAVNAAAFVGMKLFAQGAIREEMKAGMSGENLIIAVQSRTYGKKKSDDPGVVMAKMAAMTAEQLAEMKKTNPELIRDLMKKLGGK